MSQITRILFATLLCLGIAACDGDSRPFSEAVEVRASNLIGVEVVPPLNSQPEIYLNIGQQLQMGVVGLRATSGTRLDLDATDRNWRVNDPSVAEIDNNGVLRARANGTVFVSIKLGGLTSEFFPINVDNRALESINAISGASSVERCRPQDYFATGNFVGGTTRNLDDVIWNVTGTVDGDGRVRTNADGTGTLTALNVSMLNLTATSAGISLSQPVEVSDTLRSVVISPDPARVGVGDTLTLVATGRYASAAPVDDEPDVITTQVVINEQMDWSVVTGATSATVSNAEGSRGEVSGIASGAASVSAACGRDSVTRTVLVSSASTTSSSTTLSFNVDSPYRIPRSQTGGFRLLVATGSNYSEANDISDDVTWSISSDSTLTAPVSLVTSGDNGGFITPLAIGTATITVTTSDGVTRSLTVEVVNS